MRRLVATLTALTALAAGCGGGGTAAEDAYAQQQVVACTKVQKKVDALIGPLRAATAKSATKTQQRYLLRIDHVLVAGMPTLRAVKAPKKLAALQQQWLAAVEAELRARIAFDRAGGASLQKTTRAELTARNKANALAGKLGIASGCALLPPL